MSDPADVLSPEDFEKALEYFTGSRAIMRAHDAALRERVARLQVESTALTNALNKMMECVDEARRLAENWRAMAVSAGWDSERLPWEAPHPEPRNG